MASTDRVVLVVEDEPLILLNTIDDLEGAGFQPIEAMRAEIALKILEGRDDITHLFTDVDLPGMDGLQLAALVREKWPHIRILLTSGHMLPRSFLVPEGMAFLPKPYDIAAVLAEIAKPVAGVNV